MLNLLKAMFSESSDVSSMRVMGAMSLLSGVGIAVTGLLKGSDLSELSILTGVFVGAAFSGKVAQKFAEVKETK